MAELGFDASVLQALGSLEEATRVLAAVPTGPYEPTTLGLGDFATQALPVRLVAPPAIPPEAAELFPTTRYFRNGIALRLELRVIADAVTWDTHEAAHAALTALAAHVHIDAELEGLDGRALPDRLAGKAVVLWTAVADPERRCVRIDVNVGKSEHLSPQALRGCAVRILGASLANAAVAVAPDNPTGSAALPLTFPVVDGLRPGWSVKVGLSSMFASAAVSPEGLLFVPPKGSNRVNVFNAAGAALPPLELPEFAGALRSKLSDSIAIAVDDTAGVVVLGDHAGSSTRVVALNPRTGALLWSTSPGEVVDCRGLAALPRHGVVVVSSNMRKELRVVSCLLVGPALGRLATFLSAFSSITSPTVLFSLPRQPGRTLTSWRPIPRAAPFLSTCTMFYGLSRGTASASQTDSRSPSKVSQGRGTHSRSCPLRVLAGGQSSSSQRGTRAGWSSSTSPPVLCSAGTSSRPAWPCTPLQPTRTAPPSWSSRRRAACTSSLGRSKGRRRGRRRRRSCQGQRAHRLAPARRVALPVGAATDVRGLEAILCCQCIIEGTVRSCTASPGADVAPRRVNHRLFALHWQTALRPRRAAGFRHCHVDLQLEL